MTTLKETAFVDHDNKIRLQLYEDDVVFATAYPTTTPSAWLLEMGDETIDSTVNPECFTWDGTNSILELNLGGFFTEEVPFTSVKLTVIADIWPNGVVWVHPTCTPDRLMIHVCE